MLQRFARPAGRALAVGGLLAGLVAAPTLAASASGTITTYTCRGTPQAPGVLAGRFKGNVVVRGACAVNGGPAVVEGNLRVARGGALLAAFAMNDRTGKGASSLTVEGNLVVARGAAAALGCEPNFFTCIDDKGKTPSLQSRVTIGGDLASYRALGVLVHNTSVAGDVSQFGGGGGLTCKPQGIFAAFNSPAYSDYEDDAIGGSVAVSGVRSCWLGLLRNAVHGSLSFEGNRMADPDANEVLHNYVNRSLSCSANSPAVQYGDSGGSPNVVNGGAYGQCGFRVMKPNPAPSGPLEPISIRSTA